MFALEEQGMAGYLVRREIKQRKATIDAELQGLWQRIYRSLEEANKTEY